MTSDESKCVRSEAEELPSRALNTDSLTKFTPGPWRVGRGAVVSIPVWGPGSCASAFGGTEANAHLIAAAPELYEALAYLLGEAEFAVRYIPEAAETLRSRTQDAIAFASEVIAKASGQSTPSEGRLSSISAREAQRSGATEHKAGGEQ